MSYKEDLKHDRLDEEAEEVSEQESEDQNEDDEYDDDDNDDDDEWEEEPPYTVEQISSTITAFYKFLTTLHFSPHDLHLPPSSGWSHVPEFGEDTSTKSALVLSVMKHLPYFTRTAPAQIHYKSRVKDYSEDELSQPSSELDEDYYNDMLSAVYGDDTGSSDMLILAQGHESGGRTLILIPKTGEIVEDEIACNTHGPFDLVMFFDTLKQRYQKLELIGGVGRNVIEAHDIPDEDEQDSITAEDGNVGWRTIANVQRVRQIYRKYGWPDNFNRIEAAREIDQWMKDSEEQDGETWEKDFALATAGG